MKLTRRRLLVLTGRTGVLRRFVEGKVPDWVEIDGSSSLFWFFVSGISVLIDCVNDSSTIILSHL